jgi:hypothetical protein
MFLWQRDDRFKPFPELVTWGPAGAWEIVDSRTTPLSTSGAVSLVDRWLAVPLEPSGRSVARHELAHVRWSPPRLPRVRFDRCILEVVEDARIHLGLVTIELPVVLDPAGRAHVNALAAADAKRGDCLALVMRSVASIGTDVGDELRDQLARHGRVGRFVLGCVEDVERELERSRLRKGECVAPFAQAHRTARRLARKLRAVGLLDAHGKARSGFRWDCGEACGAGRGDFRGAPAHGRARAGIASGSMVVKTPPLALRLRTGGRRSRRWQPAREGSHVRYPERWFHEQAIFRRPVRERRGGGTVLVDTSGSMSLRDRDLDRLLGTTPQGARVAIYSGRGAVGELRIVAWGDRRARAEHLEPYGIGNVIDVPALRWLARQPTPRLWISDGGVSGVGDCGSEELEREAARICTAARIQRCGSLDDAVAAVAGCRGDTT